MEKDEMKKLFEKFKEAAFGNLPAEDAKEKALTLGQSFFLLFFLRISKVIFCFNFCF